VNRIFEKLTFRIGRRWKKRQIVVAAAALLLVPFSKTAAQSRSGDFCRGFAEGWMTVKGELAIVPICPIEPITPIGSTSYREASKLEYVRDKRLAAATRVERIRQMRVATIFATVLR